MKVVILAGGFGTRISEESHLKPKPMIEIGNLPILWHIMKIYSAQGFNDFIICLGYKGNIIKEFFANYYLHMSDVTFDFQSGDSLKIHNNVAEPWKVTLVDTGLSTMTGGRIKRIAPYLEGQPFMLTYGDGVSDVNFTELIATHKSSGSIVTVTAFQPEGRFGVLDINSNGDVLAFTEKAQHDQPWINGGFMVMEQGIFDYLQDDSTVLEQEPLRQLATDGKLSSYKHSGFWMSMDTMRDRAKLEELWQKGNAPWKRW